MNGPDIRLAFLTNIIPPYQKPLLKVLSERYGGLRIFISTPMEDNRQWQVDWKGLDVVVQKGLHFRRKWTHPGGFNEMVTIHFPLDTIWQLAKYKPDVIISGEMGARTLLALFYRKLTGRGKLLIWSEVTEVTDQGRGKLRGALRYLLSRNADAFLALGKGGVNYIKSLGVAPNKIFQIAYPTDVRLFTDLKTGKKERTARGLLYVGQLVERKGLIPFLSTLSKWAEAHPGSRVEFMIAGDGPLAKTLKALPVPGNVKLMFRGACAYQDLPAVYQGAGIFVLPTLADTWGLVINEAMASALPVLGSVYSQAVQEMVEDGKTGWTFRPTCESEVYGAIDRAMSCPADDLQQMCLRARKRALEMTPAYVASLIDKAVS